MRQSWSKGSVLASVFLGVALSAGGAVRVGGGPPPVILDGLWELSASGTAYEDDGSSSKVKVRTLATFLDTDGAGVDISDFAGSCGIFPATSGSRLPNAFFAETSGASIAASVKVDSATGMGTSFKGNALLSTGGTVVIFSVKGKRVGSLDSPDSIFTADFEAGLAPYVETDLAGVAAATLWHAEGFCAAGTAIPASMGTMAAAYNQGDLTPPVYDYNTGAANAGAIEGPSLTISKALGVVASFDILRETEGDSSFDESFFEVRCASDPLWSTVAQIFDNALPCGSVPVTVTVGPLNTTLNSVVGGGPFLHRFSFDTGDGSFNDYLGWYVDNVDLGVVKGASSP
jgi:hypothetical protein